MKFADLVEGMGDFSDLGKHDAALKFWLPEAAAEALEELCAREGRSMSEALRQYFAQHCYGAYAFQVMSDALPGLFRDPEIRFSRASGKSLADANGVETYWVPELGKNVVPIKVWIPARMRTDLQTLAEHSEIKLSQYVREIVISRLLGHGTLPKRRQMLDAVPLSAADDWCENKSVPMRQVDATGWRHFREGEIRRE